MLNHSIAELRRDCLIVDLEATCCRDKSIHRTEREVIEIGAVMYDTTTRTITSEFHSVIKPVRHPNLTQFCVQLTGITQAQVDQAETFPTVFAKFSDWANQCSDFTLTHWGSYDRKALIADCNFHSVPYTLPITSIDFKKLLYRKLNLGERHGLAETIKNLGLKFEGTPHSAVSDARNTARLFTVLLERLC